jgi:hydroxyethylthiazole kinase
VHALINYVAMDVSANAPLALGASPAMVHAQEEAAEFARLASAVVVNIGTLSSHWIEAMTDAAGARGTPRALDPVGVGATGLRNEASLRLRPMLIRGNASEIMALARLAGLGDKGHGPKGVDAADATPDAEAAALALARSSGAVVAATGVFDFVTDGVRAAPIHGGDALMSRVTALSSVLTGVAAAFLAARDDAFEASVAALGFYKLAGARGAHRAEARLLPRRIHRRAFGFAAGRRAAAQYRQALSRKHMRIAQ